MDTRCDLGCVVMASGAGRRFGEGNKLLADIVGLPLVVRAAKSVPTSCFDTVVSTRWDEVAALCEGLGIACAVHEGSQRSDSVRAGLAWGVGRGWKGCLFLPGDQPLVSAQSFCSLAEGFARQPLCIHRLSWDSRPASPVLFPARLFERLSVLEGSQGGRALIAEEGCVVLHEAGQPWEMWDVDIPEDAGKIRGILTGSVEKK